MGPAHDAYTPLLMRRLLDSEALWREVHQRGFAPSIATFDSWYSSLENLKLVRELGWSWLTRFKSNRQSI